MAGCARNTDMLSAFLIWFAEKVEKHDSWRLGSWRLIPTTT